MSQWSEIRHMHLVDGVSKKEIARRFGLDVKTVRRAIESGEPPERRPAPRNGRLDPYRPEIEKWLREEPRLTSKRIGLLLRPLAGEVPGRTVRHYVAAVRRELRIGREEACVHRTHRPGDTMEVDFGEAVVRIGGCDRRIKFLVATLPASNAYFAKAYYVERLECLLDGIREAFLWFGGLTRRAVLDNTTLAVRRVLPGPERVEQRAFEAFRGGLPLHVDFAAPGKGQEKGSVERGVRYVRDLVLRPRPDVADLDELNRLLLGELEADLDRRRLPDGRTARRALEDERRLLRPLPAHWPDACRTLFAVADKFGVVRVDRADYSVPVEAARRPVVVRLFHDRVEIAGEDRLLARHARVFERGAKVLDPLHVLALLERKHRAVPESTALAQRPFPPVFERLREAMQGRVRKPDREWIRVLRLTEKHPVADVAAAAELALEQGSPLLSTVAALLRVTEEAPLRVEAAPVAREDLAAISVAPPALDAYDRLGEVA